MKPTEQPGSGNGGDAHISPVLAWPQGGSKPPGCCEGASLRDGGLLVDNPWDQRPCAEQAQACSGPIKISGVVKAMV